MATQAQLLANRRNALRSTGPRSAEGKAVSRFNALKTGIQAKSLVIPGEDAAELQQLTDDYHLQFRPATPLERFLVDSLVNAEWQLRRFRALEAKLWEKALAPEVSGPGEAYDRNLPLFTRLHRRIEALERSYYRALQQLQRVLPPAEEDLLEVPPAPELASFSTGSPASSEASASSAFDPAYTRSTGPSQSANTSS